MKASEPAVLGIDRETFFREYVEAIDGGHAAVFAGAGLSRPAGFVDWRGLLRDLAKELGLDIDLEQDLVAVAQYHLNANARSRHRLNKLLVDEFSERAAPTPAHATLARLPLRTYWTSNYDDLIEDALKAEGRQFDKRATITSLPVTRPRSSAAVYKMHGDTNEPARMVITRDDYEEYANNSGPFLDVLQSHLITKTFLFLGLSFTDPNLELVLGQVRAAFKQGPRTHFAIMRREPRSKRASTASTYAARKQQYQIEDLRRYGIETVLVDEFAEIPGLLSEIEKRYYRKNIAVSGAFADAGPMGAAALDELCRTLGKRIISEGFNLVNGFGLGVGSSTIAGAVEHLYRGEHEDFDRRLRLRPFPQDTHTGAAKAEFNRRWREELIRGAGFLVIVSGNKEEAGAIILSDGVWEEYRIAQAFGLHPIPVGVSGHAAAEIWNDVDARFDAIYPEKSSRKSVRGALDVLNQPGTKPTDLVEAVFVIVHALAPRRVARRPPAASSSRGS